MPNWSATNYILRGSEKDIRRFCETVNSCYDKPDVEPNGFGKLWLGNIYAGFGNDPKTIESSKYNLRGCIDPDPESITCLFGPVPDETNPKIFPVQSGDKWVVAFSTQTAWGRCDWLDELFDSQFPECLYAWKSTDEFGNYHKVYHPELMHAPSIEIHYHAEYCIEELEFAWGEEDKAAKKLEELTGMQFSADEIKDCNNAFWEKIAKHNETHEDNEIVVIPWDLVTD